VDLSAVSSGISSAPRFSKEEKNGTQHLTTKNLDLQAKKVGTLIVINM
jgi:hypothetical protein